MSKELRYGLLEPIYKAVHTSRDDLFEAYNSHKASLSLRRQMLELQLQMLRIESATLQRNYDTDVSCLDAIEAKLSHIDTLDKEALEDELVGLLSDLEKKTKQER